MKRNFIKLIKNPEEVLKGAEPLYNTYVSPNFVPYRKMYEALEILEKNSSDDSDVSQLEMTNIMIDFICELYGNQFKKDDVLDGMHSPNANEEIENQIQFFAQGVQTDSQKKELKALLK